MTAPKHTPSFAHLCHESNALLITAAPDLLAAAEAALAEFDKCTMFDANGSRFDDLRAAIARARGAQ